MAGLRGFGSGSRRQGGRRRLLSLGFTIAAGVALLAPAVATARLAYVAGVDYDPDPGPTYTMVSWYEMQALSGALGNPGGGPASAAGGDRPSAVAMDPEGRWAYVANDTGTDPAAGNNIYQFAVDPGTGALTPLDPPWVAAGTGDEGEDGAGVRGIAVSPDGSYLYATTAAGKVTHFTISRSDGGLQPVDAVDTGTDPFGIALDPDGRAVYAVDRGGQIFHYLIDAATGELGVAHAVSSADAFAIATSPDASSVYVTRRLPPRVDQYEVDEQGSLVAPPKSSAETATAPFGLAVSPDGKSVYVATMGGGAISQFSVTDAGLLAKAPRDASLPGDGPASYAVSVAPDGASAYATVAKSNHEPDPRTYGIGQYDVIRGGPDDGELRPKDPPEMPMAVEPVDVRPAPNQGPRAALAPLAAPATEGQAVTFDATLSTDPDGSVAAYEWSFGDGAPGTTTWPIVSHVYASPGEYRAIVTVTDNEGCSDRLVFTGQTAYCNGSADAGASMAVRVGAAGGDEPPGPPIRPNGGAPRPPAAAQRWAQQAELTGVSMVVRCAVPRGKRAAGNRRAAQKRAARERRTNLARCGRTKAIKPRLLARFDSSAAAAVELELAQTDRKGKKSKRSQQRVVLRRNLTAKAGANTFILPIKASALRGALTGNLTVAGATRASQVKVRRPR